MGKAGDILDGQILCKIFVNIGNNTAFIRFPVAFFQNFLHIEKIHARSIKFKFFYYISVIRTQENKMSFNSLFAFVHFTVYIIPETIKDEMDKSCQC